MRWANPYVRVQMQGLGQEPVSCRWALKPYTLPAVAAVAPYCMLGVTCTMNGHSVLVKKLFLCTAVPAVQFTSSALPNCLLCHLSAPQSVLRNIEKQIQDFQRQQQQRDLASELEHHHKLPVDIQIGDQVWTQQQGLLTADMRTECFGLQQVQLCYAISSY